jgi:hypothetical protein
MNVNWLVIPTLALALLLFMVGERSIRCCRTRTGKLATIATWFALGVPGILLSLYYLHWFDDAKWFYEFRSIPFTELTAAGAGLFAGGLSGLLSGRRLASRGFLVAILTLGIIVPYLKPVVAPVPSSRFLDRWRDDVCLQSTPSSCGVASAATVFKALGVRVTEREIARECFTYLGGTENWYIARAFRRRGFAVNYRIGRGVPADLRTPAIAGVRVGGVGHFIAVMENAKETFVTGDPLVGRREVSAADITNAFDFTGFFLEIGMADHGQQGR